MLHGRLDQGFSGPLPPHGRADEDIAQVSKGGPVGDDPGEAAKIPGGIVQAETQRVPDGALEDVPWEVLCPVALC